MKNVILISCLTMSLSACKQLKKNDANNANVQIIENKSKTRIKEDDFVALSYTVKTTAGIIIYGNYDHLLFRDHSDFKGDFFAGLGMLGEGDSAIIKVSTDSLKAHKNILPANIPGKYLVYNIRINKVVSRIGQPGRVSDSVLNSNIEDLRKQTIETDKRKEETRLKQYITENNLHPTITASGLNYVINKLGSSRKPVPGDLSVINLTIRYVDGEVFFTNSKQAAQMAGIDEPGKKYDPLEMYIGKKLFIKGMEEGLLLLPVGTKATLIIPSKLSNTEKYGYAPLVCEIEVLNIRKPKAGEKIKMLHEDESEEEKGK
jgi:FKBP-type peptidyl-prolyl cis-trans isomerase FkpA